MRAEDALLAIQELMDGVEWTPDTLDEVAEVMRKAGYKIRGIEEDYAEAECELGIHSWAGEKGRLDPETKCIHCGEAYGHPD